jgi:choline dehydrogenase-like flavoprotein
MNKPVDVLIIGAGASGAAVAWSLADTKMHILCLDQGGWMSQAEYPSTGRDWEARFYGDYSPSPNIRARPEDYPINDDNSPIKVVNFNGVGGSTVMYTAHWPRLHPSDFRVRTLDGVADDWPITYEELLPFFERTEREVGVSGLSGNPAYPDGYHLPLPPHPINKSGRRAAEGLNRLGWHWWPSYHAIPTSDYGTQNRCVRYGVCFYGCPEGAKASTDITHWPIAIKHGARVITGARVSHISVNDQGLADGAVYIDRDGNECFQRAQVVIVAANGVGTPRVLLMSASKRFPDGLANSSGLVGKRLMLHPVTKVIGLYEEAVDEWMGPAGEHIESMQFYETDESRGFVRGSKWLLQGAPGPSHILGSWTAGEGRDEEIWGTAFAEKMVASVGHYLEWVICPEDLPEESNNVSLDPALTDSDGLPAAKIRYRYSENTRRIFDFNIARAREAHEAAGAKKTWVVGLDNESGHGGMGQAHLLGTARMGDDPESSVVDRNGCAHDVPNLYIVDGSVFVTSSGLNPTGTICALAKRTATHICDQARLQKVPA